MRRTERQIKEETRTSHVIMSLKDRRQAESDGFPPGAKLVWSEADGKLVLLCLKATTRQPRRP